MYVIEFNAFLLLMNVNSSCLYYHLVVTCRNFRVPGSKQPVVNKPTDRQQPRSWISPGEPYSKKLQVKADMDALQRDSVMKKMVPELQQQCAGRGSGLSETLVALMVGNWK